jgi:octopine/nopaline transport system permease protein
MDLPFIWNTFLVLIERLPLTLNLAFVSICFGAVLGSLLAWCRLSGYRVLSAFATGYSFLFRGTPLLIQIFLIYYGLSQFRSTLQMLGLWSFLREAYWCAILSLTLNTSAYVSEIIRGGVLAVPHNEVEAARAFGMSGLMLVRRIILPIAVRNALPAYSNEIILITKATSLASIITVMEVTGTAAKLISETFRTTEVFIVAAALYLSINFFLSRLFAFFDWILSRHQRAVKPVAISGEDFANA